MGYDFACTETISDYMSVAQKNALEKEKKTYMTVLGDVNSGNGYQVATVKAHEVINVDRRNLGNISPFHCNCLYGPNDKDEEEKLMKNIERYQKEGTCGAFMRLEDDWENAIRDTRYFRYMHTYENGNMEEADGLTMASVLFCSHGGGLITPVLSGQSAEREAMIQKFVDIALEQARKGVKEEKIYDSENDKTIYTNDVIYNEWYHGERVSSSDGESYAWCAVFVSWCAEQAGLLGYVVPCEAACVNVKQFYVDEGRYHEAGSYEPQVGDVFVHLNDDETGHVGIVVAYDADTKKIYAIEGNSDNQVSIRVRNYNTTYFDGFGSNGGIGYGTIPEEYETGDASDR